MARSDLLVAALASLPNAGPARLGRLLREREPAEAWARVAEGAVPVEVAPAEVRREWRAHAATVDLGRLGAALRELGAVATSWHDERHPPALADDIDPAPVALWRGSLPDAAQPCVAVVGTRRASAIGREFARELGAGLSSAGVVVVSGLALGVDGAAHRGALLVGGAGPLAIVGSGLDVVYPQAHHELWHEVAERGGLLTEAPLGGEAAPWRFPARNRLIAAFAQLVVVVESRAAGGSLLTVEQAARRGIDVMAVPGSVRNAAAAGTNQLLADGCAPVRDADDVLVALGLGSSAIRVGRDRAAPPSRSVPDGTEHVWAAIDDGPTSVDEIVARTGRPVLEVAAAVELLVESGHLVTDGARVRPA
ncbi:MAG: DNA-processing protein DprA [Actinobacteria bacterium]|nr:DNA-processing protein DprA [Actinomycetota bacterium]NIS32966.1 DNA-processing protein DprA [Actinomycetota bacterium]NIT96566.1 DNA-processing protein DprA [Actinomycetota bacterium]NIU20260.1 DNA-processing protein DprA [Actinomycetota bacterium]NIU67908.1 DNA-processing protein DprA [Actinomycetota bacterium]